MITVVTGDDRYGIDHYMATHNDVLRIAGDGLTTEQFTERVLGVDMFSASTVCIDELSQSSAVMHDFEQWLGRVGDDMQLILYEPAMDKRTKYYKWLKKHATIKEYVRPLVREADAVARWLVELCADKGVTLDMDLAAEMVRRCVVQNTQQKECIDRLRLAQATHALDGVVTQADIDAVLPVSMAQNAFELLHRALLGDDTYVVERLRDLRRTEQPYRVLGLLISQLTNIAAVWAAGEGARMNDVAKEIGVHPFALQQMARYGSMEKSVLVGCIDALAEADMAIKTGRGEPWDSVTVALLSIATKYSA